ncbi:histone H1.5-like [Aplochiton taeniatus]
MTRDTAKDNKNGCKKRVNIQSKGVIIKGPQRKREDNNAKETDEPRVKTPLSLQVNQLGKAGKIPGGRGLGKAGAKRLGQLLKRAIQDKKNVTGNEKVPLPTTPVRLFKYQTQAGTSCAPKAGTIVRRVSQLILRVVSQCKSRGGISMVELKQALAAGGYDVTKNNSRVNLAVKGLVRKETLLQTTGTGATGSFRLNKKVNY